MADNGTSTTTNVDIHQNALVASLVRDTKEAPSATVVAGAASDTGSITTASGIKDLDAYLTDAKAATGVVSVWFDTVTKLEIQATYGGSYTDTTSSVTAPTAWDDTTAAANAVLRQSGTYAGVYAYMFSSEATAVVNTTTGARSTENRTYTFDVGRNAGSYSDVLLATGEGIIVSYDGGSTTFKQGDTYNGSTVATITELAAYINADTTLDGLGVNLVADRSGFEKTLATVNYTTSSVNGLQNTTGTLSTAGDIWYTVGTTEAGTASYVSTTAGGTAVSDIRTGLVLAINQGDDFGAIAGTNNGQLIVTRMISGGTTTDRSPLMAVVDITPYIDAVGTSTTAKFQAGVAHSTAISNTAARTSGNFAFTVTESTLNGLRITLRNTGSVAFSSSVSLWATAVSNTGIVADAAGPAGEDNLLVSGTSIAAWTATYTSPGDYVTAYTDIAAGTTTETTAAVAAVDTDRTGW